MNALIFKGGAPITRNYLQYPQISKDLVFTYEDSRHFRAVDNKTIKDNRFT